MSMKVQSALVLSTALVLVLACGGGGSEVEPEAAPEPEEEPEDAPDAEPEEATDAEPEEGGDEAWIDAAIDRALEMETMPGTSGEASEERRDELRAFFQKHPEYEDEAELDKLADLACAFGIESAHERLHHPEPLTPYVVEVDKPGWKLVVAHASYHCTSDDWSWFTNDVQTAVTAKGILWDYANADHDVLVVKLGGEEVARVPLQEQGYLMLQEGQLPLDVGHDMPEGVIAEASKVFGVELKGG